METSPPSPTRFLSNEVLLSGGLSQLVRLQLVIKLYSSVDIWIKPPRSRDTLAGSPNYTSAALAAGGEDWRGLTYSRDAPPPCPVSQVLWVVVGWGGACRPLTWSQPIRTAAGLLEWCLRGPSSLLRNRILMTQLK